MTQDMARALTEAGYMPVVKYIRMSSAPMWTHYCSVDRAWISVSKGEPCNWCGKCAGKPVAMIGG
jgi:hypothetical protein